MTIHAQNIYILSIKVDTKSYSISNSCLLDFAKRTTHSHIMYNRQTIRFSFYGNILQCLWRSEQRKHISQNRCVVFSEMSLWLWPSVAPYFTILSGREETQEQDMHPLLCFPFERCSPSTDSVIPVLSCLHSLLQWDVTISAMALTLWHYYTLLTVEVEG